MVCAWPLGPLRSGGSNNILMQQPVSTARVCRQAGPACCLGLSNWMETQFLPGGVGMSREVRVMGDKHGDTS